MMNCFYYALRWWLCRLLTHCFAVFLLILPPDALASAQTGKISWYGNKFHGKKTASGQIYNKHSLTAAHKSLPFGTVLRVYSLHNNRQVLVEVTDRGPFSCGRLMDVSKRAAQHLGLTNKGVGKAVLEVISRPDGTLLNPENAYYVRLTRMIQEKKAQDILPFLEEKTGQKSLRLLYAPHRHGKKALVCFGPFKKFRDARKHFDALSQASTDACIIEAAQMGEKLLEFKPPGGKQKKQMRRTTRVQKKPAHCLQNLPIAAQTSFLKHP